MINFGQKFRINLIDALIGSGILLSVITITFLVLGFAPFGNHHFAIADANIQYLDLFGFLKDVFEGKNSISYSFSNILGSNNIGVFAYYLSSPVNLLLLLFDKDNLVLFYNIAVAVKLVICVITFTVFLNSRFENKIPRPFIWIFSISYALMTYNIVQSANIMWLDGVYMLPLMLLGVYKITKEKSPLLFSISTASSLLFNWYSAGINCIFAVIWLVLELLLNDNQKISNIIRSIIHLLLGFLFAALISAALILPTIYCLSLGKGNSFDWNNFNIGFAGNILSVIPENSIGAISSKEAMSVYCGSFIIIGLLVFFAYEKSIAKRITGAVFLFLSILILYWQPFILTFSLFKVASSYYSRYSYVSTFLIIFISAAAFLFLSEKKKRQSFRILPLCIIGVASISVCIIIILNESVSRNVSLKYNFITLMFFSALLILTVLFLRYNNKKGFSKVILLVLSIISIVELALNTGLLLKNEFSDTNKAHIDDYLATAYKQIETIENDNSPKPYRINRTVVRERNQTNFQAHYDESFFFNYFGIGSYTSCTDSHQIKLLDRLGYQIAGNCMNIINDSVLSTDSLLGAKYITVKEPLNFLTETSYRNDTEHLYKNDFAFPLAFKISKDSEINYESSFRDTFDYQNRLFSNLTGIEKNIFNRVDFIKENSEDKTVFILNNISKDPVYGYFFYNKNANGLVSINGKNICGYAKWMTPSIFRIPSSQTNGNSLTIELTADDLEAFTQAGFCSLDISVLSEMSNRANLNSAKNIIMENSFFSCDIDADSGDKLFTSIPYQKGWSISVNNTLVEPELLYDCLMIIPLQNGTNRIEMNYTLPYLKEGIILTIIGITSMVVYVIVFKKFLYNRSSVSKK